MKILLTLIGITTVAIFGLTSIACIIVGARAEKNFNERKSTSK